MRKLVAIFMLLVMLSHFAGRWGVISYLYENKDRIAHTIGIISEIPIAMCSSDYDFGGPLLVSETDDSHATAPLVLDVKDANFFLSSFSFTVRLEVPITITNFFGKSDGRLRDGSLDSVFHPPSLV